LDIFGLKIGIVAQDFFGCCAIGDLLDDHGNRNAHAAYSRSPAKNFRLKCDSIEWWHTLDYIIRGCSSEVRVLLYGNFLIAIPSDIRIQQAMMRISANALKYVPR